MSRGCKVSSESPEALTEPQRDTASEQRRVNGAGYRSSEGTESSRWQRNKEGIAGIMLFLGVIGVIFSGSARTFLWQELSNSANNSIIVLTTILSISLFVIGLFLLESPQTQAVK
jgi:hypothetical protein